MKNWHIRTGSRKMTCSLLNFNGKGQLATFKCGEANINIKFDGFYDFAKSKSGKRITATRTGRNGKSIVSIQFI